MNSFHYSIPTEIYFGKGQLAQLAQMRRFGRRVLLVYGTGSIKSTGLYDRVVGRLKEHDMEVFELPGVDPNPRIQTVRQGAELCRAHGIESVLAVGGGSVIDCAKVVAAAAKYEADAWDLVMN